MKATLSLLRFLCFPRPFKRAFKACNTQGNLKNRGKGKTRHLIKMLVYLNYLPKMSSTTFVTDLSDNVPSRKTGFLYVIVVKT